MFIGYFALTPEPLVRLSRNFVLRILYTSSRSGANFIRPKKCWSSRGPSSLQMTICKGMEEHGEGRIIRAPSSPWFWPSGGQSSLQLTICKGTTRETIVIRNNCRKEQLSRGTLSRRTLSQGTLSWESLLRGTLSRGILRGIDIWWYWFNIGRCCLVFGGTGAVWGSTGWYLVILGQFNLVLFGIKWYWVIKGLLCLYILKKLMVTSTNRPTDRPTNRQGEYRAICLFRKLENRKKAEICNSPKEKIVMDHSRQI